MSRSMDVLTASIILVAVGLTAPTGGLVRGVGAEVADASDLLHNDGEACEAQPGQNCQQDRNICRTSSTLTKVCNHNGGSNGCGNQTICVPENNDTLNIPKEQ